MLLDGCNHSASGVTRGAAAKSYHNSSATALDGIYNEKPHAVGRRFQWIAFVGGKQSESAGFRHFDGGKVARFEIVGFDGAHQRVDGIDTDDFSADGGMESVEPTFTAVADGDFDYFGFGITTANAAGGGFVGGGRSDATFERINGENGFHDYRRVL